MSLSSIIEQHLSEGETLQPGAEALLTRIVEKFIEAAAVTKHSGEYRVGTGEVDLNNLGRRLTNSISPLFRPNDCRPGLVDVSEENLREQHRIISTQIQSNLRSVLGEEEGNRIANDIADALLTSCCLSRAFRTRATGPRIGSEAQPRGQPLRVGETTGRSIVLAPQALRA